MSQTTQKFQIGDLVTFNNDYQNESARVDAVDYKWDAWHYFVVTDSKGLGYWTNGGKLSLNKSYADIIAERAAKQAEFANAPTYDFDHVFEANKKLDALTVSFPKALKYSDIKFNIDNIISLTTKNISEYKNEIKETQVTGYNINLLYEGDSYCLEYKNKDSYNNDLDAVISILTTAKSNKKMINIFSDKDTNAHYYFDIDIIKSIEKESMTRSTKFDQYRQSIKLILPEFKEFLAFNNKVKDFFTCIEDSQNFANKVDRDIAFNKMTTRLKEQKGSSKVYPKFLTFESDEVDLLYINRDYLNVIAIKTEYDRTYRTPRYDTNMIVKTIFPYADFDIPLGSVSDDETGQSELITKINNVIQGIL